MGFQLFKHPCTGIGSCVSVWINEEKTVIKRVFQTGATLSSGSINQVPQAQLDRHFFNELHWLVKLKDEPYLPQLLDVDEASRTLFQEYLGPDLLTHKAQNTPLFLTAQRCGQEFIEIHQDLITRHQMLKLNHSLSNMALHGGRLKLFDFKWATRLEDNADVSRQPLNGCQTVLDDEIYSYRNFMVKLDQSLPSALESHLIRVLRDFDPYGTSKS